MGESKEPLVAILLADSFTQVRRWPGLEGLLLGQQQQQQQRSHGRAKRRRRPAPLSAPNMRCKAVVGAARHAWGTVAWPCCSLRWWESQPCNAQPHPQAAALRARCPCPHAQRMRPITVERPKVLLPLVNAPMLDYTLHWLAANEVDEVGEGGGARAVGQRTGVWLGG